MTRIGRTLDRITSEAADADGIRRRDILVGDLLEVVTRNSVYSIRKVTEETFEVTGGWFDRHGGLPIRTQIAGCTWGGTAVKSDLVACCGMRLEFSNRVITSSILKVLVYRHGSESMRIDAPSAIASREMVPNWLTDTRAQC